MPDRPGLDDQAELAELVRIWREGSADIDRRLGEVWDSIRLHLRAAREGDLRSALVVRRLKIEGARLADLGDIAEAIIDDAAQATARYVESGRWASIYSAGAQRAVTSFSFTAAHQEAVRALARDFFSDVLAMTDNVDADSKRFVRRVGRKLTGFKLTSGTPARAQARRFERDLAREFRSRGIGAVIYRDGSRHSFGEYAEMLIRTKTGLLYQAGTLNAGRQAGIEYYEILDGEDCGVTEHNDPQQANGLIVPFRVAAGFPLSHPNCRRALAPRPDITAAAYAGGDYESVVSPGARADQAAFEERLRAAGFR